MTLPFDTFVRVSAIVAKADSEGFFGRAREGVPTCQCDQIGRLLYFIWLLATVQMCPKLPKYVQKWVKHPLNKPSKVCLRFLKVSPNGEISPNQIASPPAFENVWAEKIPPIVYEKTLKMSMN